MEKELKRSGNAGGLKDANGKPVLRMLPYTGWPSGSIEFEIARWYQVSWRWTFQTQTSYLGKLLSRLRCHDSADLPAQAAGLMFNSCKEGGGKYPNFNWAEGLSYGFLVDATLRHLSKISNGIITDEESNYTHNAHVYANIAMLLFCLEIGRGEDDRPVVGEL